MMFGFVCCFKQKTAYEMRISDWSSDVCSSDLREEFLGESGGGSAPVIPGMTVVHGHTIFEKVVELPGRIGLDTGAYRSGILSAMAFEGSNRWIIQEKFGTVAA